MSSSLILLAVIVGALSLAMALFRSRKRMKKIGESEERLRRYIREQSALIRTIARETLGLRRQTIKLIKEIDRYGDECSTLSRRIKDAEKIDRRIYVLDDRRTPNDLAWLVTMVHPNYKGHVVPNATPELSAAWVTGRRYVVWAVDKERALDKVQIRLPKERGFVVTAVRQQETQT